MRVYVAGKTQDITRVRATQETVRRAGHLVTYDWTQAVEENGGDSNEVHLSLAKKQKYALRDMEGVRTADLVMAIGHRNLCGTLWECGGAVILGKPLWLINWDAVSRHSVFEHLPNVRYVDPGSITEMLKRELIIVKNAQRF